MNILVIGASQGTGALAVAAALARGHHVTAFARSPGKLQASDPKLRTVAGSVFDEDAVDAAIPDHDAVILTVATTLKGFKDKPDYFSDGTRKVLRSMEKHGVKRLVVLSAMGVGESAALIPLPVRLIVMRGLLRRPFRDHEVQERMVRESGLEWVIARPGRLTDGPADGKYVAKTAIEKVPGTISRSDVAMFLVRATEETQWIGQAVQLGG